MTDPRTTDQKAADEAVLKAVEDGTFPTASKSIRRRVIIQLKDKMSKGPLSFKCPKCMKESPGIDACAYGFRFSGCGCHLTQEEFKEWTAGRMI